MMNCSWSPHAPKSTTARRPALNICGELTTSVALAVGDVVVAAATFDGVVAIGTEELVVTAEAVHVVATAATPDGVVAIVAPQMVGTVAGLEDLEVGVFALV